MVVAAELAARSVPPKLAVWVEALRSRIRANEQPLGLCTEVVVHPEVGRETQDRIEDPERVDHVCMAYVVVVVT